MIKKEVTIGSCKVAICNNDLFQNIQNFGNKKNMILVVDEIVYKKHKQKFDPYLCIKIKAEERYKTQATVDDIIKRLIVLNVDKSFILVGVGGGITSDITGYVASIYKRGLSFGLVPTTILAMVDAAIGGKNGVNVGVYKNMVGTIYQPKFILYDYRFLYTLPRLEWINGFAEIIKHAAIRDEDMFEDLEERNLDFYFDNRSEIISLIEKNVALKLNIVEKDETEKGDRYSLNFGHSFGHAIENECGLSHGNAVSIGMILAANVSKEYAKFPPKEIKRLSKLIEKYYLPVRMKLTIEKIMKTMKNDKKADGNFIKFVLLKSIGVSTVKKLSFEELEKLLPVIQG